MSASSPQLRSALRDRRFLRLTVVQTLNMLGDGLLAVGVPILLAGRGAARKRSSAESDPTGSCSAPEVLA